LQKLTATKIVLEQNYESSFLPEKEYLQALYLIQHAERFESMIKVAVEMKKLVHEELVSIRLRFDFISKELEEATEEHSKAMRIVIGENIRLKKEIRSLTKED